LEDAAYLIGDKLFERYLKLKTACHDAVSIIRKIIAFDQTIYNNPFACIYSLYLHDLPFRYLNPNIKNLLSDFYNKSLTYGEYKKSPINGSRFTGYTFHLILDRNGIFGYKICENVKYLDINCGYDLILEHTLTKNEIFNLISLITYMKTP